MDGVQFGRVLEFTALQEPKPISEHFTRILVTTGADQLLNQFRLLVGEHHVTCRHGKALVLINQSRFIQKLPLP